MRGAAFALAAAVLAACAGDDAPAAPNTTMTAAPSDVAPASSTVAPRPRVLAVGDSTLLAVEYYETFAAFTGMDLVYDAKSCRTIGIPSCGPRPIPPNVVDTVEDAEGDFDAVVVMAGYDEWWTTFPDSFDDAVEAARDKGAREIVWLTYTEGVGYVGTDGESANEAFVRNNETLRTKVASGAFPDVVLADWRSYSSARAAWFSEDGIHLTIPGAYAVGDYISRKLAFLDDRACPMPREPGDAIENPCPDPDVVGPVPDARLLYE